MSKLFVSNVSYDAVEDDIIALLGNFGQVVSLKLIRDKFTGRSRGFCFVEMETQEIADAIMQQLNGADFMGRALVVKPQVEQPPKPRFGGGGGGQGGGGPRRSFQGGGGGGPRGGGGGYRDNQGW